MSETSQELLILDAALSKLADIDEGKSKMVEVPLLLADS
jgi:hypothetical protein